MNENGSTVTLHVVSSLDGFIARKDNTISWMDTPGDVYEKGTSEADAVASTKPIDCFILGSHTYEHALELGWPYSDTPTVVLTTRQLSSTRKTVKFYSGDPQKLIREVLAPRYANLWLVGGAIVGQSFLRLDLVDEIILTIAPVLLGEGLRLFSDSGTETKWQLKDAVAYKNGYLEVVYGRPPENNSTAIIGVSDHGGWAILVTAAPDGTLLNRRRVELVDADLPKIPHHSEGQRLPIHEAVALVDRVRSSAERHAKLALDAVAIVVPGITGVALRECPAWLPSTIADRITDYRSQNVADWVMYRQALASAAQARGWAVHWYDAHKVLPSASAALRIQDFDTYFQQLRKSLGPPWNNDHKLALAAAIVAAKTR